MALHRALPPHSVRRFGWRPDHPRSYVRVRDYEGVRQSQSSSGAIRVPDAASRASAVAAVQPYLALWPVAPAGTPDAKGIQIFNVNTPTVANENYFIVRGDHKLSAKDSFEWDLFSLTPAPRPRGTRWATLYTRYFRAGS